MQGITHREMTGTVLRAGLAPAFHRYAEEAAWHASLPDEMTDIAVGRFGTKIVGRQLCSLTHFQVETTPQHFRGYAWRSDKSLACWRKWDPRTGDVRCDPESWGRVVGRESIGQHPLAKLIRSLNGKATLDVDNFTFPTAGSMVEWLWKPWTSVNFFGEPPAIVVGCVCHFIQDACIPHHSRGWLSKGHAKFENDLQAEWAREDPNELLWQATRMLDADAGPRTPRGIVEQAAMMSSIIQNDRPRDSILLGLAWTRAFLRRCLLPAM